MFLLSLTTFLVKQSSWKNNFENSKLNDSLLFSQSIAINRLAAAHRGALRALQAVILQLSDLSDSKLPPHYRELGQLIRQLSLCSAKVEVEQGSAVPELALGILQKLEVRNMKCVHTMTI